VKHQPRSAYKSLLVLFFRKEQERLFFFLKKKEAKTPFERAARLVLGDRR
jgi:hypothetical protein